MSRGLKKILSYEQFGLAAVLVCMCILAVAIQPVFISGTNLLNVLRTASLTMITSCGMVMILLLGEMDMSVGSVSGLVGVYGVMVLNATGSVMLTVIFTLVMGAFLGACNGFFVICGKINSLIATLGTMSIFRGIAYVTTGGVSLQITNEHFRILGAGYVGILPVPLLIAVVLTIICWYVLKNTVFGRYVYAIGGNKEASELAGIEVKKIKMICFIVSGMLAALTAIILASRLNSGQPSAGDGFEFNVVSAVVLGGVSLNGGKGNLSGAVLGVLILAVLTNMLTLMNVSSFYQQIARGAVILLAVWLDERKKESAQRKLLQAKLGV